MAKVRKITAEYWLDPHFVLMTDRQKAILFALIAQADDQGRMLGDPIYVRNICLHSEVSAEEIEADLVAMAGRGWIIYYLDGNWPII